MDDIKKFLIVRALPESLQRNLDYSESLERLVEKADLYFKNSGELLDWFVVQSYACYVKKFI